MEELSWRGIIRLWYQKNGTMVCECDGKKAKNTDWAMIRHLERTAHGIHHTIEIINSISTFTQVIIENY